MIEFSCSPPRFARSFTRVKRDVVRVLFPNQHFPSLENFPFPQLDREREREVSSMSVECSSEIIRFPLILSSSFSIKNNSVRGIFTGNHLENLSRDPALIATSTSDFLLFPFLPNKLPSPPARIVRNLETHYPSPVLIYNARIYSRNAQGVGGVATEAGWIPAGYRWTRGKEGQRRRED